MADNVVDITIAELLAARLCHELVSPIGAIANGLEILEDEPDLAGDAGALIGLSARQAARRLQFYRIAYGATTILADDVIRRATADFFTEGKIVLEWRIAVLPGNCRKLACNLILLAAEALPRGGQVILDTDGLGGIVVTALGEGAKLVEPIPALITAPALTEDLSPRTVQAAFTAALAGRAGAILEVRCPKAGELSLVAKIKD